MKILKFEKQRKKQVANTQKIVKKLVNKSKMARQDHNLVSSGKHIKQRKKNIKLDNVNKKKPPKEKKMFTLDDVFEAVVNGTSTNPKLKGKKKSVNTKKIIVKVTPLKIKKENGESPKKKITLSSPKQKKKLQPSALKLSPVDKMGEKKILSVKKRKSEGDVLQAKDKEVSKKVKISKSWTAVDEEISFSSDDELGGKPKLKKVKENIKQNRKINGVKLKKKTETLNGGHKEVKVPKLLNSSKNSAFGPVSKKKLQMKLSVSHLVGAKKKPEFSVKHELNTSIGTVELQKKKIKTMLPKKRKSESLDLKIETDSDSDAEILYSLSDTSDLAINDPDSSHFLSPSKSGVNSARSKSESNVEKKKSLQKGKKVVAKKSKSTSEASAEKSKKIKLLDSLKQASPEKLGNFLYLHINPYTGKTKIY